MKIHITLFALFVVSSINAQLLDLSTNYRSNWQIINPAASNELIFQDKSKTSTLNFSGRQQWLGEGIPDAPLFGSLRYEHYPEESFGTPWKWGLLMTGARAGALTSYRVQGNFAFILPLDGYGRQTLSAGINVGGLSHGIDLSKIKFASGTQYSVGELFQQSYLDMAFGVFYRHAFRDRDDYCMTCKSPINEFYIGLSIPQVAVPMSFNEATADLYIHPKSNISLLAGVLIPMFNNNNSYNSFLELSTWVRNIPEHNFINPYRTDSSIPVSTDVNARFVYSSNMPFALWAGTGYSTQGMMHFEVGAYHTGSQYSNQGGLGLSTISFAYSTPVGWESPFTRFMELSLGFAWKQ